MDSLDSLADRLPPPRGDEPRDLRRDIIDEIADHLACAERRERRRSDDESQVRLAVLKRFGNPQRLVLQLWLAAMKETIMTQRILIGSVLVLVAVCIGFGVLTWSAMNRSNAMNAALLERLQNISMPATEPIPSLDWTTATVTLVDVKGQPVTQDGFEVSLDGDAIQPGKGVTLKETPNAQGQVEYGPIRTGGYVLLVYSPWDYYTSQQIVARPGHTFQTTVVCPAEKPKQANITFDVAWPEDLRNSNLVMKCVFRRGDVDIVTTIDDTAWIFKSAPRMQAMAMDASGAFWDVKGGYPTRGVNAFDAMGVVKIRNATLEIPNPPAQYVLEEMAIYTVTDQVDDRGTVLRALPLNYNVGMPGIPEGMMMPLGGMEGLGMPGMMPGVQGGGSGVRGVRPVGKVFTASEGASAQWTIELPDEMWEAVRQALTQAQKVESGGG